MYQKRKQKRNEKRKKRIEKRNQEEEEEITRRRKIRRGLSNKRYVCSCNIENMSHFLLIIHLLFTDGRRIGGWRMEDGEDDN